MDTGLSHITLIVKNLEMTSSFFQTIFNAKEVYSSGNETFSLSREKFLLINDLWICIMEGNSLSEKTYNHIAFKVNDDEIDGYINSIKEIGVEIKPGRSRVNGEGRSIYFYDYDNHLFELHTGTLYERLDRYKKVCN